VTAPSKEELQTITPARGGEAAPLSLDSFEGAALWRWDLGSGRGSAQGAWPGLEGTQADPVGWVAQADPAQRPELLELIGALQAGRAKRGEVIANFGPIWGWWRVRLQAREGMIEGMAIELGPQGEELRRRDRLYASLNHELRSPLTTILGSLDLVFSGMAGDLPEAVGAMLEVARRGGDRLLRTLEYVREIEALATGRRELDLGGLDLAVALEAAAARGARLGEGRGLQWEVQLDPALGPSLSRVDSARTQRALSELVENAARYAPDGGLVRIGAEASAGGVRLWVEDEGPGLRPGEAEKVFEPFFRGEHRGFGGGSAGAGLGLSLVGVIAKAQGGEVGVEERAAGSRFWLSLPMS